MFSTLNEIVQGDSDDDGDAVVQGDSDGDQPGGGGEGEVLSLLASRLWSCCLRRRQGGAPLLYCKHGCLVSTTLRLFLFLYSLPPDLFSLSDTIQADNERALPLGTAQGALVNTFLLESLFSGTSR